MTLFHPGQDFRLYDIIPLPRLRVSEMIFLFFIREKRTKERRGNSKEPFVDSIRKFMFIALG